ncbi:MAG: glycosyl hydrolase family 8 [Lactobacillus crispatus]|jgi:endo-1,4-beta-D-glucanase Y|nr:glycosyl hydrolase family 8 [Lactobacillus crispatus]MCI1336020.1 glycosyl hydrolase family 8 [Lactobacillus crispatus]MCI1365460.1 glycosyl hydrolase family 8 [Lactobacillus crispatus]MCI1493994.1 glycosyl hydrolase family 8 [Lactobacillus crispatus]MCI1524038.1 glycosyl hydrolase family 8 [Lactobacillus crispatus]
MKKKWFLFWLTVVAVIFTSIMCYIRLNNNSAIRGSFLHSWRKNYVVEKTDVAYVNTTPEKDEATVLSEGQGYGMFIATIDPTTKEKAFAKLERYYLAHRDRKTQLMAWKQTEKDGKWTNEHNSATDGDLFIAQALFLAAKRWKKPKYQKQGRRLIADILRYEYNPATHALTVGNWANSKSKYYNLLRTSDVLPTMFDKFYQESDDSRWLVIKKSMLKRLNQLSHQHKSGLVPDFAWLTTKNAKPVKGKITASEYDGDYYANACRVPMNLATSKEKLAKNTLHRLLKFFSKQNTVTAGYTLKGKPLNNYQSASFSAPIYIAVNENRNQGYDNLFDSQQYIFAKKLPKNNYYDAALTTMAAVMTPLHGL